MPQTAELAPSAVVNSSVVALDSTTGKKKRGRPRRNISNSPEGTSNDENSLTAYELERLARIAAHKEIFVCLGLDEPPPLLAKAAPKPSAACKAAEAQEEKQHAQPMRQSKRQRGEAPELTPLQRLEEERQEQARAARRKLKESSVVYTDSGAAGGDGDDVEKHEDHNRFRIGTMSEKALITRAKRITNIPKLLSFITLLDMCGMEKVAAEARATLQRLQGSG